MKSAFLIDFAIARRRTAGYLLVFAAMVVVIVAIMGPLRWIALYTGMLVPLMALQVLLVNDERNDWQGFRLAMPLSRRDVVLGRYALLAAASAAGVALGLATCAVAAIVVYWAPTLAEHMRYPGSFEGPLVALSAAISFAGPLVMTGVSLPMAMCLGYTRAVQLVPVAFMLALAFAPGFLQQGSDFNASALMAFALTPAGSLAVSAGILIATFALYAVSAWLAFRLSEKRDFRGRCRERTGVSPSSQGRPG